MQWNTDATWHLLETLFCVQVSVVCTPTPQQGSPARCAAGGVWLSSTHSRAGRGAESSSRPSTSFLLTDSSWHGCLQAGILRVQEKKKKKKVIKSRMWEGATGGRKGSRTLKELNRQLQHSHLTTGSYGLKQPRRRWEEVSRRRHRRPPLNLHRFDHWDKPSMAMQPRFRNYSSDSVGSDRVFLEESNYQGMLRVMDYRKGRVCRRYFSVLPAADCRCLFFFLLFLSLV